MIYTYLRSSPFVAALLLAGCGGGESTGGGEVAPLSIPQQMTIVEAQETSGQSANAVAFAGTALAVSLPGSDFENDETRMWVRDDSMEPLQIVNMILNYVSQCGYQDASLLNAGPYRVLIDETQAEGPEGSAPQGQSQNAEGAGDEVSYIEWIVDSSRASASAPQVVKVWFQDEEERDGQVRQQDFYVRCVIYESPSEQKPYGRFTLNFKAVESGANPATAQPLFTGFLATSTRQDGLAEYVFFNEDGNFGQTPAPNQGNGRMRARVVTQGDGSIGQAFTSMERQYNDGGQVRDETEVFHIAYNEDYLARRRVGQATETKVFDRADFTTFAWRYGLYDSTDGSRLEQSSGFPVRTASGAHGWAGYHGLWFPEGVSVANGQAVFGETYNGSTPPQYSAVIQVGKMQKRTRAELTCADLLGEDLFFWDQNVQSVVRYQSGDFMKVAEWNEQQNRMVPLQSAASITGSLQSGDHLQFWSDGRGDVELNWPSQALSDTTPVRVFEHQIIDGGATELANGDLTLYGFFDAPRPQITQAQANWSNGQSPFFDPVPDVGSRIEYSFRASDLMLLQGGNAVTFGPGVDPNNSQSQWGVHSGPLLTSVPSDLQSLWDEPVTYHWEYGPNEWNQLRRLKDSEGEYVVFERPLIVEYTHADSQDPNFDGKTFRLEYNGFGDLHGLPHREQANGHWLPLLTIPTGATVEDSSTTYLVKILEAEQQMVEVPNAQTVMTNEGLEFDTSLAPTDNQFENPSIGARPTVTSPPVFVGGERVSSDG